MAATTLIDRSVLRLSGEDVRGFLQGLVTQDLALLAPDRPLWAGLLTPQGKALFDFILWADDADVLIDCEAEAAEDLARRLALYRLRRKIVIGHEESLAVHWQPCSPAKAGAQSGAEAGPRLSPGNDRADPRLPELGDRWLAPASEPAEGWLAHRLSLGVTEGRAEIGSDKTLWLECNAAELNGVSFTKGCYVGQENTARMNYRARVNRRLVVVPAQAAGERTRILYPELGLAVEHRRVEDLGGALIPDWLAAALGPSPTSPSDR
ncbi:MAG: tRNA-modifying protein YgfZ [Sphingomonadales bacterium]|jgi:folate-binding protein YgfZ|nr:tRNA-modifying protein YgfZ [Sphingomonadales bacterium]